MLPGGDGDPFRLADDHPLWLTDEPPNWVAAAMDGLEPNVEDDVLGVEFYVVTDLDQIAADL